MKQSHTGAPATTRRSQENINPNPRSGASVASHIPQQTERGAHIPTLEQSFLSDSDSDLIHDLLHELPVPAPLNKSAMDELLRGGEGEGDAEYLACIEDLNRHMRQLLSTGLYSEEDPAILALQSERRQYEQMLKQQG